MLSISQSIEILSNQLRSYKITKAEFDAKFDALIEQEAAWRNEDKKQK